jgi:hypothetical protein
MLAPATPHIGNEIYRRIMVPVLHAQSLFQVTTGFRHRGATDKMSQSNENEHLSPTAKKFLLGNHRIRNPRKVGRPTIAARNLSMNYETNRPMIAGIT